jgi:hypothetical protein
MLETDPFKGVGGRGAQTSGLKGMGAGLPLRRSSEGTCCEQIAIKGQKGRQTRRQIGCITQLFTTQSGADTAKMTQHAAIEDQDD